MPETFPSTPPPQRCPHCRAQLDVVHRPGCPNAKTPVIYERFQVCERFARDANRAPEAVGTMLDELSAFLASKGAAPMPDINRTLQQLVREHSDLIVRREKPLALFQALDTDDALPIRFDPAAHGGESYPNAAALGDGLEGLSIPYQRGFGAVETGLFAFIIGFTPSAGMNVRRLPRNACPHYTGPDRARVRLIDGEVALSDLRFIIVRFPRRLFPEDRMTDAEREHEQTAHISRLFMFQRANELPRAA